MNKLISKEKFQEKRKFLKDKNKTIVLCHGVFDLIHPGHIIHFQEAKSIGDVLIVSLTKSEFVRKGPGRPYFSDEMRVKFLSEISIIDYILLSDGYTVDDIIEVVEPDYYVKGQEYAKAEDDITGKITEEVALVKQHGGQVYYTQGDVFSSTKLINQALPSLSEEVKQYVSSFKSNYSMDKIKQYVDQMKQLKVLVLGDAIIDDYIFCDVQGLMSKDMGYSTRYKASEQYLGGALAIARHVASFSDNVTITSVVGNEEEFHSRLLNDLGDKMRVDLEYSEQFKTIVKQRFISENVKREQLNKIFVINNLPSPMVIDEETMSRVYQKLEKKIDQYDLVILCDFGHGLVDSKVAEIVQRKARVLALNCQTNSSNYGMNLITKYNRADAFSLDEKELKLAFSNYNQEELVSLQQLEAHLGGLGWLTQGAKGATGICRGVHYPCPAFTLQVKDTIGAGDAFFSIASLCKGVDAPVEVGTFLGNIGGALAANIVGNKDSVEKVNVLKYASTLLNI